MQMGSSSKCYIYINVGFKHFDKKKEKERKIMGKIFYLYYINIYIHVGFKHFDKEKKRKDIYYGGYCFYLKGEKAREILIKI